MKLPTKWTAQDSSTTASTANTGVKRIETDATIRIQEDGTVRVLEDVVLTPKAPTVWIEK